MDSDHTAKNKGIAKALLPVLLALLGLCALLSGPAPASAQESSDCVAIGKPLVIEKGQVKRCDVSVTNSNLTVNGEVQGDAVVVGGNADIEGSVKGNVTVTKGDLTLGPHGSVDGNILTVIGKLNRQPGAVVSGTVNSMGATDVDNGVQWPFAPGGPASRSFPAGAARPWMRFADLFGEGMLSLLILLLSAGVALLVPARLRVSSATLQAEPGPSVVVGLIACFILPPVVGIVAFALAISVVGLVLLPVLGVGVGLLLLFGLVTVGTWLGRRVYGTTHQGAPQTAPPLLLDVLLGMAVILGSTLIPSVFLPGWIMFLMLLIVYFVACVGVGAVILSRLGSLAPPKRGQRYPAYGPQTSSSPQPQQPAITEPLGPSPVLPPDSQASSPW